VLSLFFCGGCLAAENIGANIDYESFLKNHDMVWDRIPNRWEVAPYSGNGNVGFLFYQQESEGKNTISIFTGRHDYYDKRLPYKGKELLWIYQCRLPLGHFTLKSKGDILSTNLRLDLWNAELTGTIQTTEGEYTVRGLTHSETDVIYFETNAGKGESVEISWLPEKPMGSVRHMVEFGDKKNWRQMADAPYPMPPEAILSESDGINFCYQSLYQERGEVTTAWEILGEQAGKQVLRTSVHYSFPDHNSLETAKQNLLDARKLVADNRFIQTHQDWWHAYYPQSFLTLNDPAKEGFYWIQMYKFASATRGNGPICDLMGPWYAYTHWPMVWGDLNTQLIYWTHLTSNRLKTGESLVNNMDKYVGNLRKNVPEDWEDCISVGPLLPQDMVSSYGNKMPDLMAWFCHNYWLHCSYAGDQERMRNGFFPLLKMTMNTYLKSMETNATTAEDGTINIKLSWSPEYKPQGRGKNINFTLAMLRWTCRTFVSLNKEYGLNDLMAPKCQNILDHLADYPVDENGLRVGQDIPFDTAHRHYSHLIGLYPLAVINPEDPENAKMLKTSVDHWLDVTFSGNNDAGSKQVTGYTATGAASMYAYLKDADNAFKYLDYFIRHKYVTPTTMYTETWPVIESPFSWATSMHDMLLQSWGGKIRVFPAVPDQWSDIAYHHLRTEGAFLVSAKRVQGVTRFIQVESLIGSPCVVQTDIPNPRFYMNGKEVTATAIISKKAPNEFEIALKKGESVILSPVSLKDTDLKIEALPVAEKDQNLFGLSEKTTRLPGHQFYYKK
jgi:hypothetical protein